METEPMHAVSPDRPVSGESAALNWIRTLALDMVLPIVTYFVLAGAGVGEVAALLISGLWPLAGIAWTFARERHLDEFGAFVLVGIVIGVLTAVYSDSARAVFLKDSIANGILGLLMLLTLLAGRPLTFYLARRFATDGSQVQRDWWDGLWRHPRFRLVQRRIGAVWGTTLLVESVVRGVLTWQLGTSAMVLVNNVVPYVVIAALITYSVTTGRREQAAAQKLHGAAATPPPATA